MKGSNYKEVLDDYVKDLDEIDTFLLKEFGIMGGCCSSIESLKYSVARAVAEKLWKKYEVQGR